MLKWTPDSDGPLIQKLSCRSSRVCIFGYRVSSHLQVALLT